MADTVSGPGAMSKRTDRQPVRELTDAAYGEQKTFREDQQGAVMASSAGAVGPVAGGGVDPAAGVTPFGAPSERPGEPVTSGAPVGPGPGPESLGLPSSDAEAAALLPYLPMLERRAAAEDSSQTLRNIVQYLKGLRG
jgi:hypothetical protein